MSGTASSAAARQIAAAEQRAAAATHRAAQLQRQLGEVAGEFQSLVRDLLPTLDYIDEWLRASAGTPQEHVRVEKLRNRLLGLLITYGVRPTARPGLSLDLRYHQVVEARPAEGCAPETILEVMQMGYEILAQGAEAKTLRQAKVVVSAAPTQPQSEEKAGG